jgi:hypothetical protein
MSVRTRTRLAIGVVALATFAGCSSSSSNSSSSSGRTSSTSTTTVAKATKSWVDTWKPTLVSAYGPAQRTFLTAIQGSAIADVRTAALSVSAANTSLRAAITKAGPPPASARAAATNLSKGLGTEGALVNEVLRTCTAPNEQCRAAVTAFAQNNSKQIVPPLTALGATG